MSRPFTDVVSDRTGTYVGAIVAQGNGYRAGTGPLYNFSSVFSGSLNVPASGQVTFTITSGDGFVFGVGNGATRVSGPQTNVPATTAFGGLNVMGGFNARTAAAAYTIVVNFPAAGVYPYEVDYAKGGNDKLTLGMLAGGLPIPASTLLTLTPNVAPARQSGQVQQFTLTARDASGVALANVPVTFSVAGKNLQTRLVTTDATGQVPFAYAGSPLLFGVDTVQAAARVNGADAYSNAVAMVWNSGTNAAPVVSAGTAQTISLPAQAGLDGEVSDDGLPAAAVTAMWSMQSGPGIVTFENANQAATSASFSVSGTYVLKLTASDGVLSSNSTVTVIVNPATGATGDWLASPLNGANVSGLTPVTLVPGITMVSGVLSVYPANNQTAVTVLNSNVSGTGQIGALDATLLNNGAYFVQLTGTNSLGVTQTNLALVTVVGEYKPGRVTATVTDFIVPSAGLAIQIQRTYDSLWKAQRGDFGYGWRLGVNALNMSVSANGDVTLTVNGSRKTFYFTPQPNAIFQSYYQPQYTAEPGFYGSLVNTGDNCSSLLQRIGNIYQCAIDNAGAVYAPTGFKYKDPYGREYTLAPGGDLQSLRDLNGNTLTISASGIASSTGLSVPFVRDGQGRITQITDRPGIIYITQKCCYFSGRNPKAIEFSLSHLEI